jgi:hypothetical protein
MPSGSSFDRRSNYVNATQFAAPLDLWSLATEGTQEMSAFGEFWRRLSQLDKFNTCHWHSACTKIGGLENLITLSQALAYNRLYTPARSRARQYTAFHAYQQGRSHCFLSVTKQIYNQ